MQYFGNGGNGNGGNISYCIRPNEYLNSYCEDPFFVYEIYTVGAILRYNRNKRFIF